MAWESVNNLDVNVPDKLNWGIKKCSDPAQPLLSLYHLAWKGGVVFISFINLLSGWQASTHLDNYTIRISVLKRVMFIA